MGVAAEIRTATPSFFQRLRLSTAKLPTALAVLVNRVGSILPSPNSEHVPLEYRPQHSRIGLLAQRSKKKQTRPRRQIHPENGPERAFGMALREFRKATGISQEQFALDGGFDRTYISLLERGISSPTIRALFKLAQMLQVAPSEVVRRTEALMTDERMPPKKRTALAPTSR